MGEFNSAVPLLVVDDEDPILRVCRAALGGKAGFEVTTAGSAAQALELLDKRPFDILLTDLQLPGGMDGVGLTREARNRWPGMDVLIMTGYDTLDSSIGTLKLGAYDYIIKPLDVWLLRAALQRCVEKRRLERMLRAAADTTRTLNNTLDEMAGKLKPFASGQWDLQEARGSLEQSIRKMQDFLKALDAMEKTR